MHLNLKKYKKIASDKDSSTFKHPDGHEMKVMHRSLSPAMRKEVSAIPMAEGGYVDTVTSGDPIVKAVKSKTPAVDGPNREGDSWSSRPTKSPPNPKQEAKDEDYKSQAAKFNAKMAPEQAMAEGGVASSQESADSPDKIAADAQAGAPAPVTINIGQPAPQAPPVELPKTPEQAAEERYQMQKATHSMGDFMAAGNMTPAGPGGMFPIVAALPGPEGATPTMPGTEGTPAPEPAPAEAAGPTLASIPQAAPAQAPPAATNPFQTAYEMQLKGLQMGEKAQEMASQGKEEALKNYNDQQAKQGTTYDANVKDAMTLRQQALEALQNTKIDPDRYWNNKSTGGQISTILGIIAAGFNPTHNPNAAIDMLNKSIDRDIESQKMDIGKKQNLLSAANDHFRNIQSAADFHRVLANDLVSHQIDLAVAKAGTPMAKAELLRAQGELQRNNAVMMATIGARQTLNGHSSPDEQAKALNTLDYTDKDAAKTFRARFVPGYGVAQKDIPDSAIQEITAKKQLHDATTDLIDFIKNKGSSLSLNDRNVAAEKAQVVQSLYREGLLKTVYKQGEQPLLDKVVSENPLSFVNTIMKTEPKKLQEIIGSNQRSLNSLLKGYGVPNQSQIPQRPPVLNKR